MDVIILIADFFQKIDMAHAALLNPETDLIQRRQALIQKRENFLHLVATFERMLHNAKTNPVFDDCQDLINDGGFDDLLMRIEQIDPEASAYIREHRDTLEGFNEGSYLPSLFDWSKSAQGTEYWQGITIKLVEPK